MFGNNASMMPSVNDLQDQLAAAQSRPRNMTRVKEAVIFSCLQPELAEAALYEYLDGDGRRVTGPTITFARELLRCYGNVWTTMVELHRDGNQSQMQTCAWDMEANVWADRRVIVPHIRANANGDMQPVTDVREITGLLNDVTARRQRRCILDVLPSWLVAMGVKQVWETLTSSDIPFEDRRANLIEDFAEYDVDQQQLVEKQGMPFDKWSELTLARLRVLYNSLALGALRADEEFPPRRLTGDAVNRAVVDPELAAAATPKNAPTVAPAVEPPAEAPSEPQTPEPATSDTEAPADTKKPRAATKATPTKAVPADPDSSSA